MELGNLLFGNSRGEYEYKVNRDWQDAFVYKLYDIPFHYKEAIEYVEKAMKALEYRDNEQKTIDIYNELSKIKKKLQTK